jgi:hypothetical protein
MKGILYIEYLNGKVEEKQYDDYFVALTEQSKILKNKKKLENIMICKVLKV